jgi:DNA-binding NarL/FixJ family response regulator
VIDVLIADDHPVVRQGIRQILEQTRDIRVVAEASDAGETLAEIRRCGCSVVLLDLSMPGSDGLELVARARRHRVPILVLTIHAEDELAVRAIRAGASGYLTKETAPGELVAAIRKIAAGGRYVSEWLAERLVGALRRGSRRPELSNREDQILRLIAEGHSSREIADRLSLSIKTVATYRARIIEKLDLKTSAKLVRYAISRSPAPRTKKRRRIPRTG